MKFHIGIITPANDDDAFEIVIPVFARMSVEFGAGCTTRDDIEETVCFAIQTNLANLLRDGATMADLEDTPEVPESYKADYPTVTEWMTLDIEVEPAMAQATITQAQVDEAFRQTKEAWDAMLEKSGKPQHMFIATDKDAIQFLGQYELIRQDVKAAGFEAPPLVEGIQINIGGAVDGDEDDAELREGQDA